LFLCKLNPLIRPKALNNQDYKNIVKFAKKVLLKAIKYGGTTVSSYQSTINHSGRYQNILYVHARNGEHCKVCNTIIKKIKVNGRGTCFCPKCQHLQGETC
jgi:formamidopyrimidine-DNA glycosylase